ncbi:LysM peptidoglycan-binding domain-containing protein [Pectobacterium sp. B1J-3]|uniref:LysM peptidoglycan-binding domain-containing protein n=1 Tax=Pectobacterium sp. B1J-3 TaxID=3385371 RepID=UPI0039062877
MTDKLPLFDKPQDKPTPYDGLLGWSANWKCSFDPEYKPVPLDNIESLNPTEEKIIVKRGDTLSKIAAKYGYTVDILAISNHIDNPSLIYPGQVIKLPKKEIILEQDDLSNKEKEMKRDVCTLSFTFEDLLEKPIEGLRVKIVTFTGETYDFLTDGSGKIRDFVQQKTSELSVWVSSVTGKSKEVAKFTPMEGKTAVLISSPKVRIRGTSMAIKGEPGVDDEKQKINTVIVRRDESGEPRLDLKHTCPNDYNLSLGKNIIYWDEIIAASTRSSILPQAIAAVINAESARKEGVWYPKSVALNYEKMKELSKKGDHSIYYRSSATGMTQFLNGTWVGETFRDGTFLNEKAKVYGLLEKRPRLNRYGQKILDKDGSIVLEDKFKVEEGVWRTLAEMGAKRDFSGSTPYPVNATENVQKWLNKRFEPLYAIMAAVDYGVANLAGLKKSGFNIDGLNDAEKAKVIYLTHHLGLADTILFIRNKITEERAKKLLIAQVEKPSAIERYHNNGNSFIKAHRMWLVGFMNGIIKLDNFYCDELLHTIKLEDVSIDNVLIKL